VIAGAIAAQTSSTPTIRTLTLGKGEQVVFSVFRLFPDTARVSLEFRRSSGQVRPELGKFTTRSGPGYIEFDSPGEPVRALVQGTAHAVEYEALPGGSYSAEHIGRELVVRDSDNNEARFRWPPDNAARPSLPVGRSTVTLSVLEVGASMKGEKVTAVLESPLSFKTSAPGYEFLWWFLLWPVYVLLLAIYASVLGWLTMKSSTQRTNPNEA
jgi:hypothetical protein